MSQSISDPILESQIQQQTQAQGQYSTLASALQQTQGNFVTTTNDIGTEISNFFDSINQLSTNPSDVSARQGVLTAAGNLATSFNTTANNLTQQQTSLDLSAVQSGRPDQPAHLADRADSTDRSATSKMSERLREHSLISASRRSTNSHPW